MLTKSDASGGSSGKKTVVVSKGDFGFPNPTLMSWLKPLNPEKCKDNRNPGFRLVKGQEYEYSGDVSLLSEKYPKNHHLAGKPRGLANLFEVK